MPKKHSEASPGLDNFNFAPTFVSLFEGVKAHFSKVQ
jgi:hypothetical protein